MTTPHPPARARRGAAALCVGAAGLAAALSACNLDVETPGIVDPNRLNDSTALPTVRAGAIGDFAVGFAGNPEDDEEGIILAAGLRADEFINRDTFVGRRAIDVGNALPENEQTPDLFRNIQRARRSAEQAAARYAQLAPGTAAHAEMLNLAGYATVLIAETFCPGVPFSDIDASGRLTFGEPLGREAMLQRAVERFTEAATVAAAAKAAASGSSAAAEADEQRHLALVGRARALLSIGGADRIAQAAALVADVPTGFAYEVQYSANTDRQNNAVFTYNNVDRRWGVADREGGNGLPFVSARDPRVPTQTSTRNGLDGVDIPIVNQQVFTDYATPIPLATGVEARLIQAEGALAAGNRAGFVSQLNAARAATPGLAPLDAAGLVDQQLVDLLFRERGFALFATGHRLGDLRRALRPPYSRAYQQVFPVGQYFKGGFQYREQPSIPVPLEETNNPNFASCQAAN
jgi:hypothetical protein